MPKLTLCGVALTVAVQDGACILKTKPEAEVLYTTEQRIALIEALRIVDEVITYQDVDTILPTVDFDIFVIGEDQTHAGFKRAVEWCQEHEKKVIRMPRTPGISSSEIKNHLKLVLK